MKQHLTTLTACLILSAQAIAAAAEKPNIFFIAVDDLRPELGCYGVPVISTRLAATLLILPSNLNQAQDKPAADAPAAAAPGKVYTYKPASPYRHRIPGQSQAKETFAEHYIDEVRLTLAYRNLLP